MSVRELMRVVILVAIASCLVACGSAARPGAVAATGAGSKASVGTVAATNDDFAGLLAAVAATTATTFRVTFASTPLDATGKPTEEPSGTTSDVDARAGQIRIAGSDADSDGFVVGQTYLSPDYSSPGMWYRLDLTKLPADAYLLLFLDTQTTV